MHFLFPFTELEFRSELKSTHSEECLEDLQMATPKVSDITSPQLQMKQKKAVTCKPHEEESLVATTLVDLNLLNFDHGDPTMYEAYWNKHMCEHVMVRNANQGMSYFEEPEKEGVLEHGFENVELHAAIRGLHALVGNAVTKNRSIVVGNGSTQLFQAALYALTSHTLTSLTCANCLLPTPTNNFIGSAAVVAESPFYSGYPMILNYLQSKRFHWVGDARTYVPNLKEACIEVVTTPNNPCGELREGVVKHGGGRGHFRLHDLAYYWPSHMPITEAKDHDVMLFTLSKCSGHAGVRIGWAIVKDPIVAKKMEEYIIVNTIGVSHDAQSRAAGILRAIVKGYETEGDVEGMLVGKQLFHWAKAMMECRWERVRAALAGNKQFSLPEPRVPHMCAFLGMAYSTYPAFIWLKCEEEGSDCHQILKRHGLLSRAGVCFGVSPQYARLSLLDRDPAVNQLIKALAGLKC